MHDLVNRVLEAHGGLERWHKVESLDVPFPRAVAFASIVPPCIETIVATM